VEKYGWARQATDDNTIRRMHIVCWITRAADTHSEYVVLTAFPQQQWLRKRAWMLGCIYAAWIVSSHVASVKKLLFVCHHLIYTTTRCQLLFCDIDFNILNQIWSINWKLNKRVIKFSLSVPQKHVSEWSTSCHGLPLKKNRGAIWIGGWEGPRANLNVLRKRKISCPYWYLNPRPSNM
jgi:hypothetical protein